MAAPLRDVLLGQFDTAWSLAAYHLEGLTTEECLLAARPFGTSCPAGPRRLLARRLAGSRGLRPGAAQHRLVTWHMDFWWTLVRQDGFTDPDAVRAGLTWPGDAERACARIAAHAAAWRTTLEGLDDAALASAERTRFPFRDRPFAEVAAWLNVELIKNGAEIGYARFLHGVRRDGR